MTKLVLQKQVFELSQSRAIGLLILGCVLLLIPFALYGPHDQEEWTSSVWSTLQYVSAIWDGKFPPMWSDALGLGTPLPIGHRFDFAPPFFLFPAVSIRWVIPIFYAFYLGIATSYVWRLCTDLRLDVFIRLLVGLTFLWSAPTVQLIYSDDWPTLFHDWCLFPVLFFYMRRLFLSASKREAHRNTLLLGLFGGLWCLNGHSGHMASLGSILAVYALVMAWQHTDVIVKLICSIVIASLISSEHLYYIVSETIAFPANILRNQAQDGITGFQFIKSLLRPFDTLLVPLFTHSSSVISGGGISQLWTNYTSDWGLRIPFVGTLCFVASILWIIRQFRLIKEQPGTNGDSLAISLAFLFSFVMMFLKASWLLNIPSGTWLYRDGFVFFGLIAGGLYLQEQIDAHTKIIRWLPILMALHLSQMMAGSYPTLLHIITSPGMHYYENFLKKNGLTGWILSRIHQQSPRVFISSSVIGPGGSNAEDGVYGVTDFTFFGVRPFNSYFKTVSMDLVAQSAALGHGWIPGHQAIVRNRSMLNVFGINMLLVMTKEPPANWPVLEEELRDKFEFVDEGQINREGKSVSISLYRNNTAWPDGFLMDPAILNLSEKRNDPGSDKGCDYSGAICRNFSEWTSYILEGSVSINGKDGAYIVHVPPAASSRLFVTSKFYRPEWLAFTGESSLQVKKVGGALIGVLVPPGVNEFTLEFRPVVRKILWYLSLAALVTVSLVLLLISMCRAKGLARIDTVGH